MPGLVPDVVWGTVPYLYTSTPGPHVVPCGTVLYLDTSTPGPVQVVAGGTVPTRSDVLALSGVENPP